MSKDLTAAVGTPVSMAPHPLLVTPSGIAVTAAFGLPQSFSASFRTSLNGTESS